MLFISTGDDELTSPGSRLRPLDWAPGHGLSPCSSEASARQLDRHVSAATSNNNSHASFTGLQEHGLNSISEEKQTSKMILDTGYGEGGLIKEVHLHLNPEKQYLTNLIILKMNFIISVITTIFHILLLQHASEL